MIPFRDMGWLKWLRVITYIYHLRSSTYIGSWWWTTYNVHLYILENYRIGITKWPDSDKKANPQRWKSNKVLYFLSFFLSFYFFLLNKEKCMAWGLVAIPHIHRVSDTTRQTQWNLAWGSPKQYNSWVSMFDPVSQVWGTDVTDSLVRLLWGLAQIWDKCETCLTEKKGLKSKTGWFWEPDCETPSTWLSFATLLAQAW